LLKFYNEQTKEIGADEELYLTSLRQIDQNIAAAINGGVAALPRHHQHGAMSATATLTMGTSPSNSSAAAAAAAISLNASINRNSYLFGRPSNSFHQNLNGIASLVTESTLGGGGGETQAFPYERMSQSRLSQTRLGTYESSNTNTATRSQFKLKQPSQTNLSSLPVNSSTIQSAASAILANNIHYRANSNCKIYQDLDEYKDSSDEFKGHLV
jgi:hypothetical protein